MRKLAVWILALGIAAAPAVFAADGPGKDKSSEDTKKAATDTAKTESTKADATKTDAVKKDATTTPTNTEVVAEMEQLRALLKAQADQLEEQRRELAEMKAELSHGTTAASATAGEASGATASPTTMAAASPMPAANPAANPAAPPQDSSSPLQFRIGDATITPVGFMDFTTVWRSRVGGSGIGTNFAGVPYGSTTGALPFAANLSEFRFSMQNSRIGFRVDADIKGAHVMGYMEADFLGNNPGNVAVTSNSNTLRSRLYWVDVRKGQWEVLGGQTWSLITPNRSGISPLPADIFYSQNIDVNYQAGITWGRIPEARFVYHPSDKFALAFALEGAEQYTGGSAGAPQITCPGALGTICTAEFNNGGTTLASTSRAPDIIVKAAWDPIKRFHIEAGGVESQFHDFNPTTAAKFNSTGGGAFLNLNGEVFKGMRLIVNTFWSDGGGRYIFGTVPDAIIRANGAISPIHVGSTVDGFEYTHGNTLLYAYYGGIFATRNLAFDTNGTTVIGYGVPGNPAQNRSITEYTGGFAQTFAKSPKYGALIFMGQYSFVNRDPWGVVAGQPENAHMNMFFLNLRYLLPGSAPTIGK
ncbi:MAG TPA: hypothetical protein VKR82_02150 [Candidatus Acidoferrales bacterium]|nr:hypothetical protein [Candidatus Acidoferrales bacterium]